jgi:hypothetical protein
MFNFIAAAIVSVAIAPSTQYIENEACMEYATLHYAMAESAGYNADSAWEDAYARCERAGAESVRIDTEVE